MLGSVALSISLVSYGNAFLGGDIKLSDFDVKNAVSGVENVHFNDGCAGSGRSRDANGIEEWLEALRRDGCRKLRLFVDDSAETDAYFDTCTYGRSPFQIESVFDEYSDFWKPEWHSEGIGKLEVVYLKTSCDRPTHDYQGDVEVIRHELDKRLTALSVFATKLGDREKALRASGFSGDSFWEFANNAEGYDGAQVWYSNAVAFDEMKALLYDETPKMAEIYKDLLVAGHFSLPARQVMSAAVASWCFNGMGSWSDSVIHPYDEEISNEKDALTRALFDAVCNAYVFTVNSY